MTAEPISTTWPSFLLGAGAFLVAAFALLMPGVSQSLTGPWLWLFWAVHIFGGLAILQGAQLALMRIAAFNALGGWVQILGSGLVGALLFTPVALGLDALFGVADVTDDAAEAWPMRLLSEFTGLAGIFILIWCGLNAARLLRIQMPQGAQRAAAPAFWGRVPAALGQDIVALSAELHYLRVYTAEGDALILYAFGAALAELEGQVPGAQIHRSHWAARGHVSEMRRKGQAGVCVLDTGLALPVSRGRRAAAEAALGPGAAVRA